MSRLRLLGWRLGALLACLYCVRSTSQARTLLCWLGLGLAGRPQLRCAVYRLRSEEAAHLCVRVGVAAKELKNLAWWPLFPPL